MPLGITDQQLFVMVADLLCKSNDSLQINKKTNTIKKKLFAFVVSRFVRACIRIIIIILEYTPAPDILS